MKGITLLSLLNVALKNILILLLAAVLFGAGGFAYCEFFCSPKYSAKGSLLITNGGINMEEYVAQKDNFGTINNSDISASTSIGNIIIEMLSENQVYKEFSSKLDGEYSYGALKSMTSINKRNDRSLFIDITLTTGSREESIRLTNEFLAILPDYLTNNFPDMRLSSYSADNAHQVYPQSIKTTCIVAMFGAVLVYAVLFIIYLLNTSITTEDDFRERFDIPVLGSIPDFTAARSAKYSRYNKNKYYGYYGYNSYSYYGRSSNKNDK